MTSMHAYAWRSIAATGAPLAFGSDAPVEAPDPFAGMAAAISRSSRRASGVIFAVINCSAMGVILHHTRLRVLPVQRSQLPCRLKSAVPLRGF